MTPQEAEAILTLSLMAAFADGSRTEDERKRINEIGKNLGIENYVAIMQRVVLKQVTVDEVTTQLSSPESKSLAYEMAVYVCDADGVTNDQEREFLRSMAVALGLQAGKTATVQGEAEKIISVPVQTDVTPLAVEPKDSETESMILNYAILNAALELLPQSLATMAIIPLQMRMVYRIGQQQGISLDQGHIKEFLATVGVGLTTQMIEGFARRVLGQLGRSVGGRMIGAAVDTATGSAMTFAATYALGHVAQSYYAGGRRLNMAQLQSTFQNLLTEGKSLFSRYRNDISEKAQHISINDFLPVLHSR